MRKVLLLLSALSLIHISFAQDVKLMILTDQIDVYSSDSHAADKIMQLPQNSELFGSRFNADWFEVSLQNGQKGYVMDWDIFPEEDLYLIPKRVTPSASTLFRMMRYFRHNQNFEKAEEFALRIINTHNDEEYPGEDQACFKLGHIAYMEMISDGRSGVNYDGNLLEFTSHVLEKAENETILAMAHYHQARYFAVHGQTERALNHLLVIVDKYPMKYSSNECEEDKLDSWYYRPERAKRLFCALTIIQTGNATITDVEKELERIISIGNQASTAMAEELKQNIGSMPYLRDESVWY